MTTMKQLLPHRKPQIRERETLWKEKCSDDRNLLHINSTLTEDKRKILRVNVTAEW
jgi:hypothetical protein